MASASAAWLFRQSAPEFIPPERAAKIAIREVHEHAQGVEVVFVCFDSETHALYNRLLASHANESMSEIAIFRQLTVGMNKSGVVCKKEARPRR